MTYTSTAIAKVPQHFALYTQLVVALIIVAITAMVFINAQTEAHRVSVGIQNAHIDGMSPTRP
jgi:hypothetical protein